MSTELRDALFFFFHSAISQIKCIICVVLPKTPQTDADELNGFTETDMNRVRMAAWCLHKNAYEDLHKVFVGL